jgi:acetyltransferase-like isoleucine patch superfamily enzyme
MKENPIRGLLNRILQIFTVVLPISKNMRASLHRARGVKIGKNVWISYNVVLETGFPQLITIEDDVFVGVGVIIIAHFRESRRGVKIGKQAFIGPGVIILPDVEIGEGAVVTAGSVVTSSVQPMTVVQGNPAVPIAKCGIPMTSETSSREFAMQLRPLDKK